MRRARPGWGQVTVLHLEPKRAAATLGYAFITLVAIVVVAAALLYPTDAWRPQWRIAPELSDEAPVITASVAAVLGLLSLTAAIVNGHRWHIARVVERLSNDRTLASVRPRTASAPPTQTAATIPPLGVSIVKARKLPKPATRLRRVALHHNVIGHEPLRIAYLRLFENQPRVRTFIQGAWREFGYVYLLRSATSITPGEYRSMKKAQDPSATFISSPEQLLQALERRAVLRRGWYRLKRIAPTTIAVRDRYGSYWAPGLLCHGAFWKVAVDMLLERVDLVALDLSGYRPENRGTEYELQRVIDRFPIERVVFLIDQRSNKRFITEQIEMAWSRMAAESPNAVASPKVAMVIITDYLARRQTTQVQSGAPGQPSTQVQTTHVQLRLVARRRETRRVVATAERRLREWQAAYRTNPVR